jgi:hypothetical protein
MITPHVQCCCPECVTKRKALVRANHPILSRMHEEPAPSFIPVEQALCMALEEEADLNMRLTQVRADIRYLRDCL